MFGKQQTAQDFPSLVPGEIHLWCISNNPDPALAEQCKNALTEQEIAHSDFFKFKTLTSNYIISQGALKLLLGTYLDIEPREVKLARRPKGKPFSQDDPSLFFNMSNSGDYCVYAFCKGAEVGVDIEYIRKLPDLEELIRKNNAVFERDYINKVPEERLQRFFRHWTIKEAYVKAIGEGMRLTPDNIEIAIENERIKLLAVRGFFDPQDWQFAALDVGKQYIGTLVYLDPTTQIAPMRYLY